MKTRDTSKMRQLIIAISILALTSVSCIAIADHSPTSGLAESEPTKLETTQAEPTQVPTAILEPAELTSPPPVPEPTAEATTAPLPLPPSSWQAIPDLPRAINALIADPMNPGTLYAGTGSTGAGSGVYKSEDSGKTWRRTSEGLPNNDVVALAITHDTPSVLYAVLGSGAGDLYASTDSAANWTRIGDVGLLGFRTWLAIAPTNTQLMFITSDVRGGARSQDGGHSWQPLGEGLPKDEHDSVYVQSLAIDPTDANVIYVGTGHGPFGGNGVYKSTDGGATWTAANRGMLDYSITSLAIDPSNPKTIYAGADSGEIFKSIDGGENWSEITPGSHDMSSIASITLDSAAPQTIYVLSEQEGPIVSQDGGERWQFLGKPSDAEYPTFSAMTVIFDPQPIIVVGSAGQGGWRYAGE